MRTFLLTIIGLTLGFGSLMGQRKDFNGNVQIFSLDQFEDFIAEGYTHINGDFIFLKSTRGLADVDPPLDVHPDGLESLVEITGDITMDFSFFQPDKTQFKRLQSVGGEIEIKAGGNVIFDRLASVGGRIDIGGKEVRIPRLRDATDMKVYGNDLGFPQLAQVTGTLEIGGLIANTNQSMSFPRLSLVNNLIVERPPSTFRMPRLRDIRGDFTIESFDTDDTEAIILSQLVSVGGAVTIGGSLDNSGPFKRLAMPRLKTVGKKLTAKFSWNFFEKQTLTSLEQVEDIEIIGGAYLAAPSLKEVSGDFKHTFRTNLPDQEISIQYPSLTAVRGKLTLEAAGANAERITLTEMDFPELTDVAEVSVDFDRNLNGTFKAPKLISTSTFDVEATGVELDQLKTVRNFTILTDENTALTLPALEQLERLNIEPRIAKIEVPNLKIAISISTNARELIYSKLERITSDNSLGFNQDLVQADFRSIVDLNSLSFTGANFPNINLSSLETVNTVTVREISSLDITTGQLSVNVMSLGDIASSASFDWEVTEMSVNSLTISDVNSSLSLPITSARSVRVQSSTLNSGVLGNLQEVSRLSISESDFGASLSFAQLRSANSIFIGFTSPTSLSFPVLTTIGAFDRESASGLTVTNVKDLNLNALIQIEELIPNANQVAETSVLESISLRNLETIGMLKLHSDKLESASLGALKQAREIDIASAKLTEVSLPALERLRKFTLTGSQLGAINISNLQEVDELSITNTALGRINLGGLTKANDLTFNENESVATIDLGSLPEMSQLTLTDMPLLTELVTTKPGEEGGLIAQLTVQNIADETVEISCDNGQTLTRTFFTALRKITLDCEAFEVNDETSSRPIIKEDIQFVTSGSISFDYNDEITFPTLSISESTLSFGELAESESQKTITIDLTNTGIDDVSGSIRIANDDQSAFQVNLASFSLERGASVEVEVTYAPELIGSQSANLIINTDDDFVIPLSGSKDGCIEIGGICIEASNVFTESEGVFVLSGGVTMNELLFMTGLVTVDTNQGSISGNGEIYMDNIPLAGRLVLYSGEFNFDLASEAEGRFTTALSETANSFLRLANLPIEMGDLQFIENGIQLSAKMTLPRQLNNTEVDIEELSITSTEGINVVGEITVPGSISLAGVAKLQDISFTFNTAENEFSGSALLDTKAVDIEGTVVMRGGGVDEVEVTITPARPVPIVPIGWSLTEGTGSIRQIQSPPITLGLSVDMAPTATANFDLVKLNDLSLEYTFGTRMKGSGELTVLGQSVASAGIEIRRNSIVLEGNVNMGDFLVGSAVLAVNNTSNGLSLRGQMEAKLQIPEGDTFFHQVFDGTLGLPYEVASTKAWLNNTILSGETSILGNTIAYGVAYVNNSFEFDLAERHDLLNQELFGGNNGSAANFSYLPESRFEGRSLKVKKSEATNAQSGVEGTDETTQAFSLSRDLDNIFIRVQHATIMPVYTVVMPDGTEVTAENAESLGHGFVNSETATKQTFYAFTNPPQGNWEIRITSEDAEYAIDIAGADPAPSLVFSEATPQGNEVDLPWQLNNVGEDYRINLFYDDDNEDFNGVNIVEGLANDVLTHRWETAGVSTGEYYVYAELEHLETGQITGFYSSTPLSITEAGALAAPDGLVITNGDTEVEVAWNPVNQAADYTIYYEANGTPTFNSAAIQTADTAALLFQLDPGLTYNFAVSAWNEDGVQGPLSEAASLNYISESLNNVPVFVSAPGDPTVIANTNFSLMLEATDEEDDELSFELNEGPEGMTLNDGTLAWQPGDDELGQHPVTVLAIDSQDGAAQLSFTITVFRPNNPPTDILLSANTIEENSPEGTAIGNFAVEDEDTDDSHTLALVAGDGADNNDLFRISNNSLVSAAIFDFETTPELSIRVSATDEASQVVEKVFTISVTNVNEAPTDFSLSNTAVAENLPINSTVGTLSATDPDAGDSFTYALVAGEGDTDNAAFSITDNSLLTNQVFDFESQVTYNIRLGVTDAGGLAIEKAFTISITDAADPMIRIEETELTFPATALGLTETASFTIHNDGDAVLQVSEITVPDGFTVSPASADIPASSSQNITITFSPTEERIYSGDITVSSNAGSLSLSLTGEGAIITSIDEDLISAEDVLAYPNPARDVIHLDLTKLGNVPVNLRSLDSQGKTIWSADEIRDNEVTIDVSQWKAGMYFLRLATEKGAITKAVIIQK